MFVIIAEMTAKPGCGPAYESLLRKTIAEWSKDPCFIKFIVHRSETDPDKYMVYEMFTSEQEYNKLRSGHFFQSQLKARAELVEITPRRTDWLFVEEFGRAG